MDIVIIGTGNTATVLGKKLKKAGHHILQVFGRNQTAAISLAKDLDAEAINDYKSICHQAALVLLAVSDKAIEDVAIQLQLKDQMLVHTAASVAMNVLKGCTKNYGVFYPLQSLNKAVKGLPEIPVLVDASDEKTRQVLLSLAGTITSQVFMANDDKRVKMHLAAVMVNNFTNHLFMLVDKYCSDERIEFSILLPLIKETVFRLDETAPAEAQTGPASRNDLVTIEKHLALLVKAPQLKTFYQLFSESIQQSRT